ncbi:MULTISPECIES: hypothetical protein [Bradyrhizobium]|uniref:hypothetical protein n=1 Tax=Bradyrhizobium TaxID=374 RepID=UPI001EDA76D1|nr:hypothetical protein [Bradyrhizobium zhengyangense]MCG2645711.1 hypothetical protein [Bradyrhizobium zhengyangense]
MRTPLPLMRGATAGNRPWTATERDKLAALYTTEPRPSGKTIAQLPDRTESAVTTEASRLGLNGRGMELRKCLPCQRMFNSASKGDRICPRCEPMVAEYA